MKGCQGAFVKFLRTSSPTAHDKKASCRNRLQLLPKLKSDSGSGFSQIFDSRSKAKTQNPAGVGSGTPDPVARSHLWSQVGTSVATAGFLKLDLGFFSFILCSAFSSKICGFLTRLNFRNVCCITVFSIKVYSSFTCVMFRVSNHYSWVGLGVKLPYAMMRLWTYNVSDSICICSTLEMSTATAFRAVWFWKIFPRTTRAAWLLNVLKLRQRRVSRGYSSNDESLQNEDFSEVIVLDNNTYFSCLSYSFYLRFRDASGRRFVGRILLLVFLQVACCSHWSDALACELLIQNPGQLTGRHLTRKMLSGLQV